MRNSVLILVLFCFTNLVFGYFPKFNNIAPNDTILDKVIIKLKTDDANKNAFESLYKAYCKDLRKKSASMSSYLDVYIKMYNAGVPMVRLIRREDLETTLKGMSNEKCTHSKKALSEEYQKIITLKSAFITDLDLDEDGGRSNYFNSYLEFGQIIPHSH